MGKLDGKVAIITGASRGLGKSLALAFASEGAAIAIIARTESQLAAVAAEVSARGGKALAIAADVRRWDEVQKVVARTEETLGAVDVMVNNAGIAFFEPVLEIDPAKWDLIMDTNFKGTAYFCKAVLPSMVSRGKGTIINVASVAGTHGLPNQAGYSASKFAVIGFSEALAQEVQSSGIRITTICPGGIDTPFWETTPFPLGPDQYKHIMAPEAVAELVLTIAGLPANIVVKRVVLFPTVEWH